MNSNSNKPELTWSIFHEHYTSNDEAKRLLPFLDEFQVNSIEVCGKTSQPDGGLDWVIPYRDYKNTYLKRNHRKFVEQAQKLRDLVEMFHQSGRKVYYWHREVGVPNGMLLDEPLLLNPQGEFDLLGKPYENLIRYKIKEFFKSVPDVDGIVLTLTESQYSVIHHSDSKRFPPIKIVEKIASIFAEELNKIGKFFSLRSFGSIEQDYQDIIAGARHLMKRECFELQHKVVPYDWHPFLPFNPWIKREKSTPIAVEYDGAGEYYSPGYVPSCSVEMMLKNVRNAQKFNPQRHILRVDRFEGHATRNSSLMNLFSFTEAVRNPELTLDDIWSRTDHYPTLKPLRAAFPTYKKSLEYIKKTHYIDGSLFFHWFPWYDYKGFHELKPSGIFMIFKNGANLSNSKDLWAMLADRKTPGRKKILEEKQKGIQIAEECLKMISSHNWREAPFVLSEWQNAVILAKFLKKFVHLICAYFVEIEKATFQIKTLNDIYQDLFDEAQFYHNHVLYFSHVKTLIDHSQSLIKEFKLETAIRSGYQKSKVIDSFIGGSISDDWRCRRYTHGNGYKVLSGYPARRIGNHVFPNGFIEVELNCIARKKQIIEFFFAPDLSDSVKIFLGNRHKTFNLRNYKTQRISFSFIPSSSKITVRLEKGRNGYPYLLEIILKKS